MPIDSRLPALRRRRAQVEADIYAKRGIIDYGTANGKDATTAALQVQDLQAEYDELDYVIDYHSKPAAAAPAPPSTTQIPISQNALVAAIVAWLLVSLGYFALVMIR